MIKCTQINGCFYPGEVTWIEKFINRYVPEITDLDFNLVMPYGKVTEIPKDKLSIYWSSEPIWIQDYGYYEHRDIPNQVNLHISQSRKYHGNNFIYFPFWLSRCIANDLDYTEVLSKEFKYEDKYRFCCTRCSFDTSYNRFSRVPMILEVNKVDRVSNACFMDKDYHFIPFVSDLDKWTKKFKFCLCPESVPGMANEKIPEAVFNGCVPIWYGEDCDEIWEVFNKDRVILYNKDTIKDILINLLKNNNEEYLKLAKLPIYTKNALNVCNNYINELKSALLNLIK